jgi:nucleotide-binding universal stress UspA family protein
MRAPLSHCQQRKNEVAMFTHIVVPIDFGEVSERAQAYATKLARSERAKLTILHCFEVPVSAYSDGFSSSISDLEPLTRERFEEALGTARASYSEAKGLFLRDNPARIAEIAQEVGADLIVMGTHGRKGIAHVLMGSVAERTVRTSPIPVLTITPATRLEMSVAPGAVARALA